MITPLFVQIFHSKLSIAINMYSVQHFDDIILVTLMYDTIIINSVGAHYCSYSSWTHFEIFLTNINPPISSWCPSASELLLILFTQFIKLVYSLIGYIYEIRKLQFNTVPTQYFEVLWCCQISVFIKKCYIKNIRKQNITLCYRELVNWNKTVAGKMYFC